MQVAGCSEILGPMYRNIGTYVPKPEVLSDQFFDQPEIFSSCFIFSCNFSQRIFRFGKCLARYFRFSELLCWVCSSGAMYRRVSGEIIPDISREPISFLFPQNVGKYSSGDKALHSEHFFIFKHLVNSALHERRKACWSSYKVSKFY